MTTSLGPIGGPRAMRYEPDLTPDDDEPSASAVELAEAALLEAVIHGTDDKLPMGVAPKPHMIEVSRWLGECSGAAQRAILFAACHEAMRHGDPIGQRERDQKAAKLLRDFVRSVAAEYAADNAGLWAADAPELPEPEVTESSFGEFEAASAS
jgi:hypothetical protein